MAGLGYVKSAVFHLMVSQERNIKSPPHFCMWRGFGVFVGHPYEKFELFFSLNFPTRLFISCDWLDSSSLAAALSCAVAEFVCTTLDIWSIPGVI